MCESLRARALVSWKTRDSGSRTNERRKVGVYGHVSMDFSYFYAADFRSRSGAKFDSSSIAVSASFSRSRFPLSTEARVERYLRSRRIYDGLRSSRSTIGCRSANTSFGKSYRLSRPPSAVQPAYRLLAPQSSRFFLDSFTHALAIHRRHRRRIRENRVCIDFETKRKKDRRIRLDE